MKANKLTKGSNMFWESSRMVMPEHREAYNQQALLNNRKQRVTLDDQEKEIVYRALAESYQLKQPVNVELFDEYEDRRVIGIVERVDMQLKRFKVDGEWFDVRDVLRADIESYEY